jgi:hypothetical protein
MCCSLSQSGWTDKWAPSLKIISNVQQGISNVQRVDALWICAKKRTKTCIHPKSIPGAAPNLEIGNSLLDIGY